MCVHGCICILYAYIELLVKYNVCREEHMYKDTVGSFSGNEYTQTKERIPCTPDVGLSL